VKTVSLALILTALLPDITVAALPGPAGHRFVQPRPPAEVTRALARPSFIVRSLTSPEAPVKGGLEPGGRGAPVEAPDGVHGRRRLFQYTNAGVDPRHRFNSCGQAAVATVLTACSVCLAPAGSVFSEPSWPTQ
jgi:hypothetical protein